MNERIKEMAKLAQMRAEWMTPQGLEWFDNFKEEFTELIVRECAEVGSKFSQAHPLDIQYQIKRHFGVEE